MTDRIDRAFAALDQLESPLSWGEITTSDRDELPHFAVVDTEPRRGRRPAWQPLAAAVTVLVLLAGGAWLATRSSTSPSGPGVVGPGDPIEVGVVTVTLPEGMTLDGSVSTDASAQRVRALVSTAAGTCTVTSSGGGERNQWLRMRNTMAVEQYNVELAGYSELRSLLGTRIATLDEQIAARPAGADAPALISQRDAALRQIDSVNQAMFALAQAGPERPPVGEGFTPTDDGRTTWRAQATPRDVVQVACPDAATAQQLVAATALPTG